ncbi:30S ribosomal protein S2 [Candidatus Microgenomates bacterium]|nr:30S ribosomal protein S2 [Candidatus Microgenomates bacterium]
MVSPKAKSVKKRPVRPSAKTKAEVSAVPSPSPALATTKRTASTGVDVRELLKVGAHFGHRVSHWHPKMAPFIYTKRDGIYIIDLLKTAAQLEQALAFVAEKVAAGKQILFVGTKRHTKEVVKEAAQAAGMPYITERWFGGTLTNYPTISKRVKYLKDMEEKFASGQLAESMSKRELQEAKDEMVKLNGMYEGLKSLTGVPGALFVADVLVETTAIAEAKKLGVPIVAIVDTNGNPTPIDHVIPANDDGVACVKLISNLVAQAITAARPKVKDLPEPPVAKVVQPVAKIEAKDAQSHDRSN